LGWLPSVVYGLSGMTGITSSMYVHRKLMARWHKKPE
jgi:hypothetical protein